MHDFDFAAGQDEQRQQKFRHAAQADRQQTANSGAHVQGKLLGRDADPVGQHRYCGNPCGEHPK